MRFSGQMKHLSNASHKVTETANNDDWMATQTCPNMIIEAMARKYRGNITR